MAHGMPWYSVRLMVNVPYPKEFTFREQASSIGTAINRAVTKMRKGLKGKKIKELTVKAVRLGGIKNAQG